MDVPARGGDHAVRDRRSTRRCLAHRRAQCPGSFSSSGVYLDVVPPERLVFTWAHHADGDFAGARGHETTVRVEFRSLGNRTQLTLIHGPFADTEDFRCHREGWDGSFGKLETLLRGAP